MSCGTMRHPHAQRVGGRVIEIREEQASIRLWLMSLGTGREWLVWIAKQTQRPRLGDTVLIGATGGSYWTPSAGAHVVHGLEIVAGPQDPWAATTRRPA